MDFEQDIKRLEYLRDNIVMNHAGAVGEINVLIAKLRECDTPGLAQGAPESAQGEAKAPLVALDPGVADYSGPGEVHIESKHKKKSK